MEDWRTRTAMLIGDAALERLSRSAVAVFGLGGVGSFTAEALARAGVGRLVLVDGDTVSLTNLNRQLVALHSTLGQNKAEVMAQRVRDINPDCRVEAHPRYYLPDEPQDFLAGCDLAADCIDMVTAKIALAQECRDRSIPLVSAMGCGNKLDPTRFRVAPLEKTSVCPLCRVMRRELGRRGITGVTVVYSDEQPVRPHGAEDGGRPVPASISYVPSSAGLLLAGEILRRLTAEPNAAE